MTDKPQLKAVWYLYEDGSRDYVENCVPMKLTPRWIKRLWSRLTT